jgi:serine/threonine protein kinase
MRSPLPMNTTLQSRYRLLELMAEGGFARTYLAQDQGRFNERCVVKEFCPSSGDVTVFKKAKELFQREAQTLYQIEHDQVPKFRALFTTEADQDPRLFLVQDYVAGQTYRSVLQERLLEHKSFSESEVRQLLESLLPVLSYIHGQGIIHRDISLENLILRSPDQTPVLIDFGVVKTVVTQLQQSRIMPVGTVVGKFGYAPMEQLQSGRAYPSSDLYSLAVCCLVLLTGLEPAQLFDDGAGGWKWRSRSISAGESRVNVSDEFAALLDRMLSQRPSDRFGTAEDVLRSLQALPEIPRAVVPLPSMRNSEQSVSDDTQGRTIAVVPPAAPQDKRPLRRQDPIIPPVRGGIAPASPPPRPSKANPWLLIFVGLATAVFSAGLGWLAMQLSLQRPWQSKTTPVATPSLTPTPTPTASIRYSEALTLVPGQTTTVQGSMNPNESLTYKISGTAEDTLSAQLSGSGITFSILQSDLTPVSAQTQGIVNWRGTLPRSGTYYIQVQNDSARTAQSFQLNLALAEPEPEPSISPSVSPTLTPTPTPTPIPLSFINQELNLDAQGETQALSGQLKPNQAQRYIITIEEGQSLSAAVTGEAPVTLTIRSPSGGTLNNAQNVLSWESSLSEPGTYQIDVVPIDASVNTNFAITVGLRQP